MKALATKNRRDAKVERSFPEYHVRRSSSSDACPPWTALSYVRDDGANANSRSSALFS